MATKQAFVSYSNVNLFLLLLSDTKNKSAEYEPFVFIGVSLVVSAM